MTKTIEEHFGLFLIAACLIGLLVPGLQATPSQFVIILVAALIFISAFKIQPENFRNVKPFRIALFYSGRFIVLPIFLYTIAQVTVPSFALGIFLLALMPTGASCPAFCNLFGGNVGVAFVMLVLTTLLTPLVVPALLRVLVIHNYQMDLKNIFVTLGLMIFMPIFLSMLVRKSVKISQTIYRYEKAVFLGIMLVFTLLAIGKQQHIILQNLTLLAIQFCISSFIFVLFFVLGWLFPKNGTKSEKITYSLCSGCNNNSLGIALSLAYFSPPVSLFLIITEFSWSLWPFFFKNWLKKALKDKNTATSK